MLDQTENKQPKSIANVEEILNVLKQGKRILITGAAGTGKTRLLKSIIPEMLKENNSIFLVDGHKEYDELLNQLSPLKDLLKVVGHENINDLFDVIQTFPNTVYLLIDEFYPAMCPEFKFLINDTCKWILSAPVQDPNVAIELISSKIGVDEEDFYKAVDVILAIHPFEEKLFLLESKEHITWFNLVSKTNVSETRDSNTAFLVVNSRYKK